MERPVVFTDRDVIFMSRAKNLKSMHDERFPWKMIPMDGLHGAFHSN